MRKLDFGRLVSWGYNGTTSRNFFVRLVLWTAALILILYAALGPSILKAYAPFFQANFELQQNPEDPESIKAIFGVLSGLMGKFIVFMLVFWAVVASAETAYHKNVFFKEDRGFFPLRFGGSELKLMVAQLFVCLCWLLTYFGAILALVLIIGILGALGGLLGSVVAAILVGLASLVGIILFIWVNLYVFARLSPAGAATIMNDRIITADAWRMTKGNAAPIVFGFLLIGLVGYVVMSVVQFGGLSLAFPGSGIMSVMMSSPSQDPSETFAIMAEQITNPGTMITLILAIIMMAVFMPLWYIGFWGIGNRAVLELSENN